MSPWAMLLPVIKAFGAMAIFYAGLLCGAAMTESNQKKDAAREPLMELVEEES